MNGYDRTERTLRELSRRFSQMLVWYAEIGANDNLVAWDSDDGPIWISKLWR